MTSRTRIYFLSLCLFVPTLASGCGGGEPETVEGYFNSLVDEALRSGDALCDCYVELGDPSREACVADIEAQLNDPALRQCTIDAYSLDEAASLANLECDLEAGRQLADCYESSIVCSDIMGTASACLNAYISAAGACPPLPGNVVAALEDC